MGLVIESLDTMAIASGTQTTVAAADTVQTTLREVRQVLATIGEDLVLTAAGVTITISDQVASPGAFVVKTWMATTSGNTAPIAATTFGKKVHWIAVGK